MDSFSLTLDNFYHKILSHVEAIGEMTQMEWL